VFRRSEDQNKVRKAISVRHVDSSDVPTTARISQPEVNGSSQKKRKAAAEAPVAPSRPANIASSSHAKVPSAARVIDVDEEFENEEPQEEEAVDELYCTMTTNIVGVQYYNGASFLRSFPCRIVRIIPFRRSRWIGRRS
jgi:SWI/SNF-related matrix-associated actin-dependent regulator of chromatin subfamily A3